MTSLPASVFVANRDDVVVDAYVGPSLAGRRSPGDMQDAEAWRDVLIGDLQVQRERIRVCRDYFNGRQPLKFATQKFREVFGEQFREAADNWLDLVVSATSERMRIVGVRMGGAGEAAYDEAAWAVWQANSLDVDSQVAHVDAMVCGISYVLVGPQEDGTLQVPRVTVEDPAQAVVRLGAGDRRRREAGLKVYEDSDGSTVAWVYLPGSVTRFRREVGQWDDGESFENPFGVVPLVPIVNRPTSAGTGVSDLLHVLSLQDEINKLTADILVASEFASFRQRIVMGWEPGVGDDMTSALSRLWTFDKDVRVEEFSATDTRPLIQARESAIQRLAARTRTPPHYLLGQSGAFPSGESLKATETGLVAKCRERMRWYEEGWEEALRIAVRPAEPGVGDHAEIVWADPESRTEGELVDALVKMRTLGVPYEALLERWGASPQEVSRWLTQRGLPRVPADPEQTTLPAVPAD